MTEWIKHDGGPQPVADDVWVECAPFTGGQAEALKAGVDPSLWNYKFFYRILNQHLIDAARIEGIRDGLEAAHMAIGKELNDKTPLEVAATIMRAEITIVELDPETIAKETAR
jgi:hypothetical protein